MGTQQVNPDDLIATQIRMEMARLRLTATEVAHRLGTSPYWMTRRLDGRTRLTVADVVSIAEAIGVRPRVLFQPMMEL